MFPLRVIFAAILKEQLELYGNAYLSKPNYVYSDMFLTFEQTSVLDIGKTLRIGIRDSGVDTDKDFLTDEREEDYRIVFHVRRENLTQYTVEKVKG